MSPAPTPRTPQEVARMLGVAGCVALLVALFAAVVVGAQIGPLTRAIFAAGAQSGAAPEADEARAQRFRSAFDGHLAQIDGRSMFFIPAAPPPPPRAAAVEDDKPARAPTRYDGPAIIAMINGAVWFADGRRLEVGGEADASLRVLSQNGPWSAKVVWQGVEFDVPLFERTTERFLQKPPPPASDEVPSDDTQGEQSKATHSTEQVDAGGAADAPQEKDPA